MLHSMLKTLASFHASFHAEKTLVPHSMLHFMLRRLLSPIAAEMESGDAPPKGLASSAAKAYQAWLGYYNGVNNKRMSGVSELLTELPACTALAPADVAVAGWLAGWFLAHRIACNEEFVR